VSLKRKHDNPQVLSEGLSNTCGGAGKRQLDRMARGPFPVPLSPPKPNIVSPQPISAEAVNAATLSIRKKKPTMPASSSQIGQGSAGGAELLEPAKQLRRRRPPKASQTPRGQKDMARAAEQEPAKTSGRGRPPKASQTLDDTTEVPVVKRRKVELVVCPERTSNQSPESAWNLFYENMIALNLTSVTEVPEVVVMNKGALMGFVFDDEPTICKIIGPADSNEVRQGFSHRMKVMESETRKWPTHAYRPVQLLCSYYDDFTADRSRRPDLGAWVSLVPSLAAGGAEQEHAKPRVRGPPRGHQQQRNGLHTTSEGLARKEGE